MSSPSSLGREPPLPPALNTEDTDAQSDPSDNSTDNSELNAGSAAASTTTIDPCPAPNANQANMGSEDSLTKNPFDSPASRVLFDAIDKLQSFGANKFVDVPQLVIVGGQSVGKSSLLQSLTDIPFPVGKDICTRFATRIVSRRSDINTSNQIVITIEPPDFKTEQLNRSQNNSYKDFRKEFQSLNAVEFADIIEEASEKYMEIRPGKGLYRKNFATEVLKIEVSGPSRSYFSILDIPGIFVNDYNVCDGEMDGVRSMVIEYMKQPGSIIICVADACNDLANQEIFKLANTHVDKARLIGVFTKCDRTNNLTSIVDIVNGKVDGVGQLLHRGWFVVRNKTEDDDSNPAFDLAGTEKLLFDRAPWHKIEETRRGSAMLKKYLGELLSKNIQAAFPVMLKELRRQLQEADSRKEELGPVRLSTHERRAYLADIAQEYQKLTQHALNDSWNLDDPELRTRQIARDSNEDFSKRMRVSGHTYPFENHGQTTASSSSLRRMQVIMDTVFAQELRDQGKLQSYLDSDDKKDREGAKDNVGREEELLVKIREEIAICSSTQLPGMVHPDVIQRLYKQQTAQWRDMAADHVGKVAASVLWTAEALLNDVCPSSSGSLALLHGHLQQVIQEAHEKSVDKVMKKLRTYCHGDQTKPLQTTDPEFARRLQVLRSVRMVLSIGQAVDVSTAYRETHSLREMQSVEDLGVLLVKTCHHSAASNMMYDVHDTLKVYYEVSLQSFIRYVTNTIVEDFLQDVDGPLKVLSPDYIYKLSESEINRLGSESGDIAQERKMLESRMKTLLAAQETAKTAMATASQQA